MDRPAGCQGVSFDIDGDGQFGETADRSRHRRLQVTIPWTRLRDFGLGDNLPASGVYTIAVRAANEDNLSTTAFAQVRVNIRPSSVSRVLTPIGHLHHRIFRYRSFAEGRSSAWRVVWETVRSDIWRNDGERQPRLSQGGRQRYLYELDKDTTPSGTRLPFRRDSRNAPQIVAPRGGKAKI
jgi:hypothetical protein